MDERPECPDQKLLVDFVARRLDKTAHRQVETHVDTCRWCSETVEWITTNSSKGEKYDLEGGVSDTRALPPEPADERTPSVEGALEEDSYDSHLLAPSSKQGVIGRLGKYDVQGVVGQGGMGIVFKAFDEQLRRTVAIKVLNRQLASSPVARRRFIREARAAAGIKHGNVITVYAVEESQNCPFLVMEYVEGCSLRDHINRHRHLRPIEVVQLSQGIAAGLAAAHAQGVVHRDIKPSNIMLEEGGLRVKITDFGLARAAVDNVDLTSQGAAVGTAAYMSPEQVNGDRIDLRSDLFSLGCVMYAMVTGHSPFQGRNSLDIACKVADCHPPPLEKTHEGTPPMLSEIVSRLLEKKPDRRFQSATEVAEVLNRYLTILNQTPTDEMSMVLRTTRLPRRSPRHWLRWALPAAATVLIVALGVLLFRPGGQGEPGTTPGKGPLEAEVPMITVGSSPEADAASIGEALGRARPGTVIRIVGGERYVENIVLSDPVRHRGVTLESGRGKEAARATLAAEDDTRPVIAIDGVSDVVVRGLRIEGSPQGAVAVSGASGGIVFDDVECTMPQTEDGSALPPAVNIQAQRPLENSGPIVVRNSRIDTPALGQCALVLGSQPVSPEVRLEGNRFSGRGVLVLIAAGLDSRLGSVVVAGNLFVGGPESAKTIDGDWHTVNGVNLNVQDLSPDQGIVIHNNTFVNIRTWLGLVASSTDVPGVTVANNLILGSAGVRSGSGRLQAAAENWCFQANWWEPADETEQPLELQTRFAEIHDVIEVINRDNPDHPDYVRPPGGSPLLSAGWDEGGLPKYVGARGLGEGGR